MANSFYVMEGPWGGSGGNAWTDGTYSSIKSITLRHGYVIDAIQVVYGLKGEKEVYTISAPKHGGTGGFSTLITFDEDEYLTKIEGHVGFLDEYTVIGSLKFTSNKRTYGPYDTQAGNSFASTTSGKIVGFYGRSGTYLDSIGIYEYVS